MKENIIGISFVSILRVMVIVCGAAHSHGMCRWFLYVVGTFRPLEPRQLVYIARRVYVTVCICIVCTERRQLYCYYYYSENRKWMAMILVYTIVMYVFSSFADVWRLQRRQSRRKSRPFSPVSRLWPTCSVADSKLQRYWTLNFVPLALTDRFY